MSLADFRTPNKQSNFRRTEFIDLSPGSHILRILTEKAVVHDTHYIRGATIKCLGDECPICNNNTRLRAENPSEKNISTIPGFVTRRQVAYLNVLDRTPTKVCAKCQAEVKKVNGLFPGSCPKCNASLAEVKAAPLNKVKVLSKGKQFFEQLDFHNATVLDEETQTPIGIQNFDLNVLAMGGKTAPVASPLPEKNDVVTVPEDQLFDLEKAIIVLKVNEIQDLLRGVNLSDIFAARREMTKTTSTPSSELSNQMADLFDN